MKCNVFLLLQHLAFSTSFGQPSGQVTTVPFYLVGHTIIVEAVVNGQPGNFIFDTGAPKVFLNSAYYNGVKIPWKNEAVLDVNGHTCEVLHHMVKDLALQGRQLFNGYALVADLKGLEQSKGISIAGILGYPVFRDFEVLLDFDKNQMLLLPLDRKGRRLCNPLGYVPMDSLEVKMSGHFPCVMAQSGGRKLRLGIDSGAEVNVFDQGVFAKEQVPLEAGEDIILVGMKSKSKMCRRGKIPDLQVGHWTLENTEVVVTDFDPLNKELDTHLEGMLGVPFLMQGKMAINYKQRKLFLWEGLGDVLAEKNQMLEKTVAQKGLK